MNHEPVSGRVPAGSAAAADAATWLDHREPAPPEALRARIDAALADAALGTEAEAGHPAGAPPLAVLLAEAGIGRLRAAIELGDGRGAAHELLAADALLTYAFEAAAEVGPDAVAALGAAYSPGRLAHRLEGDVRPRGPGGGR